MKKLKTIPKFKSEKEEDAFWQKHDSTEYIDWSTAKLGRFPNLKLSTQTISLRLPESLLIELKTLAHKQDVPYQSLMKLLLVEGIHKFKTQH